MKNVDKETIAKWALEVDWILETEGKPGIERHARRSIGYCDCGGCFCCYCREILANLNGED